MDLTEISVDDPMVTLTKSGGDHNDPGALNPGETWVYTGDYTVTQADIDNVGESGIGLISNTVTVSCNEHAPESSSIDCSIILTRHIELTPGESKPVANFSTSVTGGYVPLSVQFTDKSTGSPTSWSWDFNNDGVADSSVANPPAYTYTTPGTYTVNLTVGNSNGIASKTDTINVLQATSSNGSSGGSSHSSGGSSGSANVVNSGSTDASATANVTQPENNTTGLDQINGNKEENVVQTPEQKATSTPAKKSTKTPGFEIILGITALLAALVYRRK